MILLRYTSCSFKSLQRYTQAYWNPHVKSWSLGMVSLGTLRRTVWMERNLISRVLVKWVREKPMICTRTQLKYLSNNPEVLCKYTQHNFTLQPNGSTTKLAVNSWKSPMADQYNPDWTAEMPSPRPGLSSWSGWILQSCRDWHCWYPGMATSCENWF